IWQWSARKPNPRDWIVAGDRPSVASAFRRTLWVRRKPDATVALELLRCGRDRFEPQDHAVGGVASDRAFGRDVDVPVGTLLHVADAHVQLREQLLTSLGLRWLIERDAQQHPRRQRADEEAVLPLRKLVAGVPQDARRADRRHPEHPRVVHAGTEPRLIRR